MLVWQTLYESGTCVVLLVYDISGRKISCSTICATGIVDLEDCPHLTYEKATELGIECRQLPLEIHMG